MKTSVIWISLLLCPQFCFAEAFSNVVLAIHGGYAPDKPDLTPELTKNFCTDMQKALAAGFATLRETKNSLNAVQSAVIVLEDSPLFNAGKGAVYTHEGSVELDASLMEGKEKKAGAVASISTVKNPILAARAVMEKTPHVLLVGLGADAFAKEQKLELVSQDYFKTERRWKQHLDDLEKEKKGTQHGTLMPRRDTNHELGTVGAVALDASGTLAAATSTGGLSNKKHGRVGDSPIIGAGTYADNAGVAVSATGHGEYFIRFHVASEINDLVKYKKMSLKDATHHVLFNELNAKAGEGGVIALDRKGNASLEANSEGMLRGYVTDKGKIQAFVYDTKCL